jgi:steroid delta-isomerase-like uncharacterized protein
MRSVLSIVFAGALAACSASGSSPSPRTPTMPSDSSKQLVRRLFADYINTGDLDRLGEVISADFVGPTDQRGPAGFAGAVAALRIGFPDIAYTLDEIVAEGDRVAVRWTWTGTHTGSFRSFPPSGKRVANRGFAVFAIADGKIVRSTIETDRLGFLIAVGAIPDSPAFGPPQPPAK